MRLLRVGKSGLATTKSEVADESGSKKSEEDGNSSVKSSGLHLCPYWLGRCLVMEVDSEEVTYYGLRFLRN